MQEECMVRHPDIVHQLLLIMHKQRKSNVKQYKPHTPAAAVGAAAAAARNAN